MGDGLMEVLKNITIHLTEEDVKQIIAEYVNRQKGYSVTPEDVTLKIGSVLQGYGTAEHEVQIFERCDVNCKGEQRCTDI